MSDYDDSSGDLAGSNRFIYDCVHGGGSGEIGG
jgi:hypothetical protein